jgi:addiction module RelE/StbE family toxin
MINIGYDPSFKRAYKKKIKRNKQLEELYWDKVKIFMKDPFDERLNTHKLSGELKDLWSFSIGYDMRVAFYFANGNKVVFVDIGTHDEIY